MTLDEMKKVDIRTVDPATLHDRRDVRIDSRQPKEKRIVHLIEKILIYDGKRIEVCFRYKDELENALQYIERFEDVLPSEEGVTMPERRNA